MSEDTFGLDLFDETASAVGNFPQTLRGYDRGAVDAYVRDVESQLARAKAQLRQLRRQLTEAQARASDTDYAKLGGHTRGLLKAAESQADELVTTAEQRARQILAQAEAQAQQTTLDAKLALDATQAVGNDELQQLRHQLSEQTAAELQAAKDEAGTIRDFAQQQAAQILADAETRAQLVAEEARLAAEATRGVIERETAEQQLSLATQRQADLAELAAARDAAAADLDRLLNTAAQQASDYAARLEQDSLTWDQRRQAAQADAAQIRRAAEAEATTIVTTARDQAEQIRADALRQAEADQAKLEADVELLQERHRAIIAQLGELSALAASAGDPEKEGSAS